uniref:Uncharacterized protein n=1 Tax=Aplanochytrium stocchinoi TaxID=215587 RepID=A0A7S3PJ17_9STRA|mmetsp:Transcript_16963/g.21698  ORF Transcript_16963/g.21698 Transcript_16963/m.21698 type:complete len:170 (+) Transcript_16963:97-606(+)
MEKQTDTMETSAGTQDGSVHDQESDADISDDHMSSNETVNTETGAGKSIMKSNDNKLASYLPDNVKDLLEDFLPVNFQVNKESILEVLAQVEEHNYSGSEQIKGKYREVVDKLHLLIKQNFDAFLFDRFDNMVDNFTSELDLLRRSANELELVQCQAREYAERISRAAN